MYNIKSEGRFVIFSSRQSRCVMDEISAKTRFRP